MLPSHPNDGDLNQNQKSKIFMKPNPPLLQAVGKICKKAEAGFTLSSCSYHSSSTFCNGGILSSFF
jgi:hypothetical protein